MPMHESGTVPRRYAILSTAGTLCAALALIPSSPGVASAAPQDQRPVKPGDASMGVGVRMHEGGASAVSTPSTLSASVEGVDVSSHQGNVNWSKLRSSGVRWAYAKATEGTGYSNSHFAQQYNGSYKAGMIRGAYHFAIPSSSSGATQASYFVKHGGGWSADGKTLPGVLDIEYNPYGATCYGKSHASMVNWIRDFSRKYKSLTGRNPVIYTTTGWWKSCTGNSGSFARNSPLWLARFASSSGPLPAGWRFYTFWQYTSSGPVVGDHNIFNGSLTRLKALAKS
jgi:GH25 family lysozyme M1 (1,4-beta-N-acetylmuramidase)